MSNSDLNYSMVWFDDKLVKSSLANLNIKSAAVLYGLSVYTVFSVNKTDKGLATFRLKEHYNRLEESTRIMGIDTFPGKWNYQSFCQAVNEIVKANNVDQDALVRVTVHVTEQVPGTRSRGLETVLSMFVYPANAILPKVGARLKSSVWRRVPDNAIPARAKVNGAYVNSVLAKQDALDSGYDDCIFLDAAGHVCELSAANIFIVRNGTLITPDTTSDLLEGINRRTILEICAKEGIPTVERTVDLTEVYIADEAFACGTSAFVAPIIEVDARQIGDGKPGDITQRIAKIHDDMLHGRNSYSNDYLTYL